MSYVSRINDLIRNHGSTVIFHRELGGEPCLCVTPEGYRDPKWHIDNPDETVCNERGILPGVVINSSIKAFVQPVQSSRATRLSAEQLVQMFGEVQVDDHLGIFPLAWNGLTLNFDEWDNQGSDYVFYDQHRYVIVNVNRIPGPDGRPNHYENGLRRVKEERFNG